MKTQFDDGDLLRAVFLGCAFARNSMDVILAYQAGWVMSCLAYGEELDAASKGHYRSVYARLSVEPDIIHLLVDVLELRFVGCQLLVKNVGSLRDSVNVVCSALFAVWKLRRFSESRLLSVGKAACSMVTAKATGFRSLLQFSRSKPSVFA